MFLAQNEHKTSGPSKPQNCYGQTTRTRKSSLMTTQFKCQNSSPAKLPKAKNKLVKAQSRGWFKITSLYPVEVPYSPETPQKTTRHLMGASDFPATPGLGHYPNNLSMARTFFYRNKKIPIKALSS